MSSHKRLVRIAERIGLVSKDIANNPKKLEKFIIDNFITLDNKNYDNERLTSKRYRQMTNIQNVLDSLADLELN